MKNHHILIQFFLLGSVRPLKSIMWLSFPFSFIKDLGSISGLLFFLISLVKFRSEFKLSRTFYYFFNDCYGPIVSISALIFYIFCMSRNPSVSCIFYMLLTIGFQSIFLKFLSIYWVFGKTSFSLVKIYFTNVFSLLISLSIILLTSFFLKKRALNVIYSMRCYFIFHFNNFDVVLGLGCSCETLGKSSSYL